MKDSPLKITFALILLVALGILLVRQGKGGKVLSHIRKGDKKVEQGMDIKVIPIQLALLEARRETSSVGKRNIFRFAPPPLPKGKAQPPARPVPPPPPPPKPTTPPPNIGVRPGDVEPIYVKPSITFKFLGSFGPEEKKLAVISDGESIYDVFEGETFMDKFVLKKIGYETIEVGFVGLPETIREIVEVGS